MTSVRSIAVAWASLFLAVGLLGLAAEPVQAQQTSGDCQLGDNFRTIESRDIGGGARITWIGLADLRCPNGLRIRADSAVIYEPSGRNELLGNVRFTNPERDLRSDRADWYEQEGRLIARGRVVFGDLTQGTEVRGETLNYVEARGGREEQVTVSGGRPTATLPADEGPDGEPGEPFRVTANQLRFQGEQYFWGDGEVEVEREDLTARADSLAFDRTSDLLILNGDAEMIRGEVVARGGSLNLTLMDDRLRTLLARSGGQIETEEFVLSGLEVRITLDEDEEVETVLAQGGEDPDTGERLDALLETETLFLRGDRVEVDEGSEGLRQLTATGRARAESMGAGFGSPAPDDAPDADPGREIRPDVDPARDRVDLARDRIVEEPVAEGPGAQPGADGDGEGDGALPDRDWIEGDVIQAFFEDVTPVITDDVPAEDTEAPGEAGEREWRLVRLESTTNARALYRSLPEAESPPGDVDPADVEPAVTDPTAVDPTVVVPVTEPPSPEDAPDAAAASARERWSISYILADRIIIHLVEGAVSLLEAEGNVRGLQLEPRQGETG